MKHPLDWIPLQNRRPLFYIFLAGALALFFLFQPLNRPLATASAPSGIVSLQLAWTPDRAREILASWDARATQFAAFGLGFDYLFMPFYALALAFGSLLAAGHHPGWFARLGGLVAWAAFFSAILDALENLGQFHQIFNLRLDLAATIGVFASLKFLLLLLALAYSLVGWLWRKS